jgi:hypothetical protein
VDQHAQAEAEVVRNVLKRWKCAAFAMRLTSLLCAAKTDEGLAAGFFRAEAGADAFIGVQRDMAFEFGGEVLVCAVTLEETAETMGEGSEFSHVYLAWIRNLFGAQCLHGIEGGGATGW